MPEISRRDLLLGLGALPLLRRTSWSPDKHLLLDSRIVERQDGVRLALGTVRKAPQNPLFGEDRPWELRIDNLYGNVVYDEEERIYKLWYSPFIRRAQEERVPRDTRSSIPHESVPGGIRDMGICYATSTDGLVWQKPDLGQFPFEGSTRNNIVMSAASRTTLWEAPHGAGIFKDPRDPDPSRRYKMIFMERPRDSARDRAADLPRRLCVSFSRDGLRWQDPIPLSQPSMSGDTHNNALWAPSLGRYVAFTRRKVQGRIVTRAESEDFVHWTAGENVFRSLPSEPARETYAMPVFAYANVYLGLVMMLNRSELVPGMGSDTVDCELAWSPDTVHWERVCPGTPLIPRGPQGSSPDWGCVFGCAAPILREGTVRLYYGGNNGLHSDWRDGFLCLAYLRPDGFAGMEPEPSRGTGHVITRPLENTSGVLRISADADGGSVRTTVLDEGGQSLAISAPVSADVTDAVVRWERGSFGSLTGRTVRLRFDLTASRLYAFSLSSGES